MRVDPQDYRVDLSFVYVGAAGVGKRSNLGCLADVYGQDAGPIIEVFQDDEDSDEEGGSYLELKLGKIGGLCTRADCFTVSPQALTQSAGQALIKAADVLILVVDSRPEHHHRNLQMMAALTQALVQQDRTLEDLPVVFQWNHQDAAGAMTPSALSKELDPRCGLGVSALARDGAGVWETHLLAVRAALSALWLKASASQRGSGSRSTPEGLSALHAPERLRRPA